jgi:hypothetical protein
MESVTVNCLCSFLQSQVECSCVLFWIIVIIHSPVSIRPAGTWLQIVLRGGSVRHFKAEKAKTHERIVAIASEKFRERRLAGIGIADLMKQAGLTLGCLYEHFESHETSMADAVGSVPSSPSRSVWTLPPARPCPSRTTISKPSLPKLVGAGKTRQSCAHNDHSSLPLGRSNKRCRSERRSRRCSQETPPIHLASSSSLVSRTAETASQFLEKTVSASVIS